LIADRRQSARDAGEERRQDQGKKANALRVVADVADALRVVPYSVCDLAQRGLGQCIHRGRAGEQPAGDQVIDLQLRAVADSENRLAHHAIAGDATIAAEESREDQGADVNQFDDAQRDHGKTHAGFARDDPAQQERDSSATYAANQRHEGDRDRKCPGTGLVHGVNHEERAQPGIHRVAKRQHAALPEQHVVRKSEDHGYGCLRQDRQPRAAAKDEGRGDQ
jgi:hypothetical protein